MKLNYCPECGAPLSEKDSTVYVCQNGHPYYNNPRATIAVVFINGDNALFSKRGIEPGKGKYDFPGGFIDYKEDCFLACSREVQEEMGISLDIDDLHLLTAYPEEYLENVSVVDMIFIVTKSYPNFKAADDSAALEWKPLSFIESSAFNPKYPGLEIKIREYLSNNRL